MKKMMKSKVVGILVMILAAIVGGAIGFFSFAARDLFGELFTAHDSEQILVIAFAVMASILILFFFTSLILCIYIGHSLKADHYSQEEDSNYEKHEGKLSIITMLDGLVVAVQIIVVGMVANMNLDELPMWIPILLLVTAGCTIASIFLDIRCIALIRKVRPEITASPVCLNYGKEYMNQIDELEARNAGEAAVRTIRGTIGVISVYFLVALLFQASLSCYFALGGVLATVLIMFRVNTWKVEKKYKKK